jgi:hypothetical protein
MGSSSRKAVLFCKKEPKNFYLSAGSTYPAMAWIGTLAQS